MLKRLAMYILMGLTFFVVLYTSGYINALGTTSGVLPSLTSIFPPFLVFFYQLVFSLMVFDYSRETFYHENLVKLVRHQSRIKVYLQMTRDNFIGVLVINLVLLLASFMVEHGFHGSALPLFIMQTLGVCGVILVQEILEIKLTSVWALWLTLAGFMLLNAANFVWIRYIHTVRFSGNVGLAIGIEILVIAVIAAIGAFLVRKQEILE